ncbi:SAM-dependent methyltransferase [Streptomyces sp. NPDC059853]|uniref:SAM-dependent methyltransferase n=1 Tax=Streptomyces sp. NPDC059853 TaxID=3346973 RepID=UPI003664B855
MSDEAIPGIDLSRPSIARTYDYLIGGKDHYAVDREFGDEFIVKLPGAVQIAIDNRQALVRAVGDIAAHTGIRQFIDFGSGLPTADNVHQIAERHTSQARVVYIDNDPIVLAHGRALLAENAQTTVLQADIRDPRAIKENPELLRFIDFGRPVGVILSAVLHHLNDDEDPYGVMRYWREAVPSGSYFFISHFRSRRDQESAKLEELLQGSLGRGRWRTDEEIAALFDGLDILEPGILPAAEWRPRLEHRSELTVWQQLIVAGLAVKP